jgi:hypothetical protein
MSQLLLTKQFNQLRSALQDDIGVNAHPDVAVTLLREKLNLIRQAAREELVNDRTTARVIPYIMDLVDAIHSTLSVARTKFETKLPSNLANAYGFSGQEGLRRAIGAVLTIAGFAVGLMGPGFLMAIAGIALLIMELPDTHWVAPLRLFLPRFLIGTHPPSQFTANIEVDGPSLVEVTGKSLLLADKLLLAVKDTRPTVPVDKPLEIDNAILSALQELYGALGIENGRYAKEFAQTLATTLAARGLTFVNYRDAIKHDFDAFSRDGARSTQTLRPAVYQREKLMLRGAVEIPA